MTVEQVLERRNLGAFRVRATLGLFVVIDGFTNALTATLRERFENALTSVTLETDRVCHVAEVCNGVARLCCH